MSVVLFCLNKKQGRSLLVVVEGKVLCILGTEYRAHQGRSLMVPKRVVTLKDVIRTLERDTQMSNSSFMYRLYERSAVAATKDEKVKDTSA